MIRTTFFRGVVAGLVLLAAPVALSASPVTVLHDESVDGPLANSFSGTDLGDLAVGENIVRGSIDFPGPPDPFLDTFQVSLKAGQVLQTLTVSSTFVVSNNALAKAEFDLLDDNGNVIASNIHEVGTTDDTLFGGVILEGDYVIALIEVTSDKIDPNGPSPSGVFNYEISLDVTGPAVIPVPASLPLLGAGLLGLGALARRRRKAG